MLYFLLLFSQKISFKDLKGLDVWIYAAFELFYKH